MKEWNVPASSSSLEVRNTIAEISTSRTTLLSVDLIHSSCHCVRETTSHALFVKRRRNYMLETKEKDNIQASSCNEKIRQNVQQRTHLVVLQLPSCHLAYPRDPAT